MHHLGNAFLLALAKLFVLSAAQVRSCFNHNCGRHTPLDDCVDYGGNYHCQANEFCAVITHDSSYEEHWVTMACEPLTRMHSCQLAQSINPVTCNPRTHTQECQWCCINEQCLLDLSDGIIPLATTTASWTAHGSTGNQTSESSHWEYRGVEGIETWGQLFPECNGHYQSPIDIDTSAVVYDPNMGDFDLHEYSSCQSCHLTLANVGGHTAEVKYYGPPIVIRGGNLPAEFVLDQYHFHWGETDDTGSEHTINFRRAPMEMHIVHHEKAMTFDQAKSHPFGLAVLAFLFKVGRHNPNFDHLLMHFSKVIHRDQEVEITPFILKDLLPYSNAFFRYYGSLTTPPCYESVIWSIFKEEIEISLQQLDSFRSLRTLHKGDLLEMTLVNNYRPVQSINGRLVTTNE